MLIPYFISACFSFGSATAKDIQTILITRFFAGLFGSAPVTNTGGVLGDIWSPQQRGTAIVGYAFAVVGGPTIGPIAGGAIVSSYLRWRWTEYVSFSLDRDHTLINTGIDHRYPATFFPSFGCISTGRILCTSIACEESTASQTRKWQLGVTCSTRGMGCQPERTFQQIFEASIQTFGYSYLLLDGYIRILRLWYCISVRTRAQLKLNLN